MKYVSEALATPPYRGKPDFVRADLEFRGIDHSGASYEARVYVNNPDADEETGTDQNAGYVGSFWVFGHGGCFGDEGHCDVPTQKTHAYDYRPPHQLLPLDRVVDITRAVQNLAQNGESEFTVTVVPIVRTEAMSAGDEQGHEGHKHDHGGVLQFDEVSLATYQ